MELALNSYAGSNPSLLPAIVKVTELIEASDHRTTAAYDHALSSYIQTGDDSALAAMAPVIQADAIALAIRSGELTAEEAQEEGAAGFALGFDFGGDGAAPAGDAPADAPQGGQQGQATAPPATAQRVTAPAFGAAPQPRQTAPQGASQTGQRGPRAQARWDDATPQGSFGPASPFAGMTPAAARAAARDAMMSTGRAIIGPQGDGSA